MFHFGEETDNQSSIFVQLCVNVTLKALLGSGGIAMAAPVIWSCMIRDWSAAERERQR